METLHFYNRKIAALSRSIAHLTSLETLSPKQEEILKERKKDLMVFKGKRTKFQNSLSVVTA